MRNGVAVEGVKQEANSSRPKDRCKGNASGLVIPWPDSSLICRDNSRGSVEYLRSKQQQQQQQQQYPIQDMDSAPTGPKDTPKEIALQKTYDYAKVSSSSNSNSSSSKNCSSSSSSSNKLAVAALVLLAILAAVESAAGSYAADALAESAAAAVTLA
ncbi:50S ribosomal protein L24, putative [Eimeria maxima]|uniref:50S ribosomal protein L24, putative n=1 Tax=Eimeria maxima TaxID=5804 RepID=U6MER0_EIMMA|nr:50S ribosomal protein L24, putative [Eimeria maxima]CDJ60145.1 50S ribosomal protein L24, putative [Eimeria maxima]